MSQRGIENCLFSISSGKTDSSEAMNSQLQAGWLKAHGICYDFVRPISKSRVLKLIYFHQLMGQYSSKRRRRRTLKHVVGIGATMPPGKSANRLLFRAIAEFSNFGHTTKSHDHQTTCS